MLKGDRNRFINDFLEGIRLAPRHRIAMLEVKPKERKEYIIKASGYADALDDRLKNDELIKLNGEISWQDPIEERSENTH